MNDVTWRWTPFVRKSGARGMMQLSVTPEEKVRDALKQLHVVDRADIDIVFRRLAEAHLYQVTRTNAPSPFTNADRTWLRF